MLSVGAHPGQQFIVSEPLADRGGELGRVLVEASEPSLDNVRHVTLLRTTYTPVIQENKVSVSRMYRLCVCVARRLDVHGKWTDLSGWCGISYEARRRAIMLKVRK